ncbi:hypothetical protein SAMN05444410_11571 [Hydrobacter penzbergensis]|uniref:Uncharacterized protein n=1 Tax=Hydrobacter penzbergensis TaxID=1235997 RepID=A0A8X8IGY0_9BACT|nr:hypothetical protein SAMN05444410_11571 [Hydrobacter penzbergensis]
MDSVQLLYKRGLLKLSSPLDSENNNPFDYFLALISCTTLRLDP